MEVTDLMDPTHLQSGVVAIAIVVVALLLILLLNRKRLLVRLREWRTRRCLNQIGSEQIRGLVCADGLDGHYRLDRLALCGDAILLIAYKPYGGNIYCAERISEWTQVVGQKSFKFANPLFELENQLTALRQLCGNATLRGFLFFDHSAVFPKGHPEAVLTPDNLPQEFTAAHCAPAKGELQAVWEALKTHQVQTSDRRQIGAKT